MDLREMLELERKCNKQKLEQKLKEEKYKNQQQVINNGIQIVGDHINITTMAILSSFK